MPARLALENARQTFGDARVEGIDRKVRRCARLRLEANSNGQFQNPGNLNPYVKDAYLKWTFLIRDVAPRFRYASRRCRRSSWG
jgi:hypothetical protein